MFLNWRNGYDYRYRYYWPVLLGCHLVINRGNHHVLYDDVELMKLIRDPQTLTVLKQLQEWYEIRCQRKEFEAMENCQTEDIKALEKLELLELLKQTRIWLKPPQDDIPIKKRKLRKVRPA